MDEGEVRERHVPSVALTKVAIELMVSLMREEEEAWGAREGLLLKCVENVRGHRSVLASLTLLARTAATYPVGGGREGGQEGAREGGNRTMAWVLGEWLEKEQGLWSSLVVEEVVWFQEEVRRVYGRGREGGRERGRKGGRERGREGRREGRRQ
jgi:hypothetical protein